jgi:hypothetical protein
VVQRLRLHPPDDTDVTTGENGPAACSGPFRSRSGDRPGYFEELRRAVARVREPVERDDVVLRAVARPPLAPALRTLIARPVERFAVLRFAVERFAVVRLAVERFAVLRFAVERFAVLRFVVERFAVLRFAVDRAAVARFAVERFAVLRFAVERFAVLRFAVLRFAVERAAVVRFAVERFAGLRFAVERFAVVRLAVERFAVLRFAVERFAGLRFAVERFAVLRARVDAPERAEDDRDTAANERDADGSPASVIDGSPVVCSLVPPDVDPISNDESDSDPPSDGSPPHDVPAAPDVSSVRSPVSLQSWVMNDLLIGIARGRFPRTCVCNARVHSLHERVDDKHRAGPHFAARLVR